MRRLRLLNLNLAELASDDAVVSDPYGLGNVPVKYSGTVYGVRCHAVTYYHVMPSAVKNRNHTPSRPALIIADPLAGFPQPAPIMLN